MERTFVSATSAPIITPFTIKFPSFTAHYVTTFVAYVRSDGQPLTTSAQTTLVRIVPDDTKDVCLAHGVQ